MIANEFRLGNRVLVPDTGQEAEITAINKHVGVVVNSSMAWINIESVKPIPLTEEWLIKFGFESEQNDYDKQINCFVFNQITLYDHQNGSYSLYRYNDAHVYLPHVHQLQNLYFALTSEELSIK